MCYFYFELSSPPLLSNKITTVRHLRIIKTKQTTTKEKNEKRKKAELSEEICDISTTF